MCSRTTALNWTKEEIQDIEGNTGKLMKEQKALRPQVSLNGLLMTQGIINTEKYVEN